MVGSQLFQHPLALSSDDQNQLPCPFPAPGALSCNAIPQSRAQRLTPHTRPLCFINNC